MIILYGRRRLGKNELVRQAITDRDDAVDYQAVESTAQNQLEQFIETVTIPLPALQELRRNWETLLAALGDRDAIVVIDEFPFLFDADRSLLSRIQRVWDTQLQGSYQSNLAAGEDVTLDRSVAYGPVVRRSRPGQSGRWPRVRWLTGAVRR